MVIFFYWVIGFFGSAVFVLPFVAASQIKRFMSASV